jgi:2-amino-4-hydroxy-6-hydroxymethyldihydropteridine diphosphokinase
MARVYVSAGSNLGDRKLNLDLALDALGKASQVIQVSSFYETEPTGYLEQPWFLNIAIELESRLTAPAFLDLCHFIESSCGRIRSFRDAPRTLDLDILLFGRDIIRGEKLTIPHPRLQDRKFVLEPLAQIASGVIHPVLNKPIRLLLSECTDSSIVRLWVPVDAGLNSS